jgi:hypothetical protein
MSSFLQAEASGLVTLVTLALVGGALVTLFAVLQ